MKNILKLFLSFLFLSLFSFCIYISTTQLPYEWFNTSIVGIVFSFLLAIIFVLWFIYSILEIKHIKKLKKNRGK